MGRRRRSALVLSAGGMFGAYQAGVWKELSQVFSPDIVAGASVGSLNGWQIACRRRADDLIAHWLELQDLARVRWRLPRHPAEGALDSSALEAWIRRMCDGAQPCCELGVVLTHLRTMRPTLFRSPGVTWRHVATSCAVPFFLRHHRIDGEYYSDGGLVDPLPLRAALDMGADVIVTVNLLKHRPWAIRSAVQAIHLCTGYRAPEPESVPVIDISPSGRLGSGRESMYWSRTNAQTWIDRGREDARRALPRVIECVEGTGLPVLRRLHRCGGISHPSPEGQHPAAVPLGSAHTGSYRDQAKGL